MVVLERCRDLRQRRRLGMAIYHGNTFEVAKEFKVMFDRMDKDKEKWTKDYSVLVDFALHSVGVVKKDVTV